METVDDETFEMIEAPVMKIVCVRCSEGIPIVGLMPKNHFSSSCAMVR